MAIPIRNPGHSMRRKRRDRALDERREARRRARLQLDHAEEMQRARVVRIDAQRRLVVRARRRELPCAMQRHAFRDAALGFRTGW